MKEKRWAIWSLPCGCFQGTLPSPELLPSCTVTWKPRLRGPAEGSQSTAAGFPYGPYDLKDNEMFPSAVLSQWALRPDCHYNQLWSPQPQLRAAHRRLNSRLTGQRPLTIHLSSVAAFRLQRWYWVTEQEAEAFEEQCAHLALHGALLTFDQAYCDGSNQNTR